MNISPPRLTPGDGIGIVAPAGPVNPSEIQPGIALLESKGYQVFPGSHLYDRLGYLAGDDQVRLQDLHTMFENDRVKVILCARGGYGTLRLLPEIAFDLIRTHPKIISGYSDISALLLAVHEKTGLVTFHGPMVKDMTQDDSGNLAAFLDLVSGEERLTLDLSGGRMIRPGQGRGPLLGGNLTVICHLAGTPFMPSLQGALLFIEERGEDLYRIDRLLTQLRVGGLLEGIAGLILGGFDDCGDFTAIERLVAERCHGLDIPILSGLPVGHGPKNRCLPLGVQAFLDAGSMSLSMEGSWVSG